MLSVRSHDYEAVHVLENQDRVMSSGYFAIHCPFCSNQEGKPVFSAISYWAKHPHDNVPLFDVCPRCGYCVTTNEEGKTIYGHDAAVIILQTHNRYAETNAASINELLDAVVAPSVYEKLEHGFVSDQYIQINTVDDVNANAGFPVSDDPTSCTDLNEKLI